MTSDHEVDRRTRTRVGFQTKIFLLLGDTEVRADGDSRDLSLNGVFIKTRARCSMGDPCSVRIALTGTIDELILEMDGRVARREDSGVAVHFESMDVATFTHLKNIIRYNSNDSDEL